MGRAGGMSRRRGACINASARLLPRAADVAEGGVGWHLRIPLLIERDAIGSLGPCAQVFGNARRLIRADNIGAVQAMFDDDRRARMNGEQPAMIPVVAEDPAAPSALPTPDSWTWFTQTGKTRAPSWHNEVTLRSVEMFTEYEPISYAKYVSPTPMMIVVALGDVLTVSDLALEAYEQALGPKRLVTLSGGHFDAYVNDFEASSGPATEWFVEHLGA